MNITYPIHNIASTLNAKSYTKRGVAQLEKRLKDMNDGNFIDLGEFFDVPNENAHVFYGDVVSLVSGSGYGKTALMQQLVSWLKLPTLYVSPEISYWLFMRRMLQQVTGMSKSQIYRNYSTLIRQNIELIDNTYVLERGINKNNLPATLEEIQEELDVKIIVLDHMKLMDFNYGNIRGDLEEFYAFIKSYAVRNELIVFLVSQVPKSSQGLDPVSKKTKKVRLEDASEAGGIFEISDVGITLNAPMGRTHPARVISIEKGRDLNANAFSDMVYAFIPQTMRFQRVTIEESEDQHADIANQIARQVQRNSTQPINQISHGESRSNTNEPTAESRSGDGAEPDQSGDGSSITNGGGDAPDAERSAGPDSGARDNFESGRAGSNVHV